jgi:hypothetical protein
LEAFALCELFERVQTLLQRGVLGFQLFKPGRVLGNGERQAASYGGRVAQVVGRSSESQLVHRVRAHDTQRLPETAPFHPARFWRLRGACSLERIAMCLAGPPTSRHANSAFLAIGLFSSAGFEFFIRARGVGGCFHCGIFLSSSLGRLQGHF